MSGAICKIRSRWQKMRDVIPNPVRPEPAESGRDAVPCPGTRLTIIEFWGHVVRAPRWVFRFVAIDLLHTVLRFSTSRESVMYLAEMRAKLKDGRNEELP